MADVLDKVIDTAKKLRKVAKKLDDNEAQSLIVDLNLHLADLKMQLAELQVSEMQARAGHQAHDADGEHPETPSGASAVGADSEAAETTEDSNKVRRWTPLEG